MRRLTKLPGTGKHSRRFRNQADAHGVVRISIVLINPETNGAIPGNMTRSVRVRGAQVSALARAVERLVGALVREPADLDDIPEAASGAAEVL